MNGVTLWSKTIPIEHEIPSNQILMHQSPNHINSALKFSTLNSPFLGQQLTIQNLRSSAERGEGDAEIEVHKPTRHPKE